MTGVIGLSKVVPTKNQENRPLGGFFHVNLSKLSSVV